MRQYKDDKPLPTGTAADYVSTRYGYTLAGRLDKVTDNKSIVWSYTCDQHGRKHISTDPDTDSTSYEYDDLDRLLSTTDSLSNTTTTVCDKMGSATAPPPCRIECVSTSNRLSGLGREQRPGERAVQRVPVGHGLPRRGGHLRHLHFRAEPERLGTGHRRREVPVRL
ncbi:hypothetical protein AB0N06_27535 [Streptomyces sp. NPDC051020]|uniref:hypothetical protein n=1 Tax=Streptomyces sp. NPDC051020 TaxID=3155409 RepID=UPI0034480326